MAKRGKSENQVEITTESGFSCVIDRSKLNNWRITRAAVRITDDPSDMNAHKLMMLIFDEVLDPETQKKLEEYASVDGIPQTEKIETEISDILDRIQAKNS